MKRRDMAREAFAGTAASSGADFGSDFSGTGFGQDVVFPMDVITAKRPRSEFDFGRDLSNYFGAAAPLPPAAPKAPVPAAPKAPVPAAPSRQPTADSRQPTAKKGVPAAPSQSKLTPLHPVLQPPPGLKSPLALSSPVTLRAPSVAAPGLKSLVHPGTPAVRAPSVAAPGLQSLVHPGMSIAPQSSGFRSPIAPPVSAFAPTAPIGLRAPGFGLPTAPLGYRQSALGYRPEAPLSYRPEAPLPYGYRQSALGYRPAPPPPQRGFLSRLFHPEPTQAERYHQLQRAAAARALADSYQAPGYGPQAPLPPEAYEEHWYEPSEPTQAERYHQLQRAAAARALADSYQAPDSGLPEQAYASPPELSAPSAVAPPPPPPPPAQAESHWYEPWTWGASTDASVISQGTGSGAPSEFDDPNFVPPTVKSGSTGKYVSAWQEVFMSNPNFDFSSLTQGTFDDQTAAFTKQWQSDHGLKADGIVGPQTWKTMLAIVHSDDPDDTATYPAQDDAQGDAFGREYGREYYGRERIRPFHRHPQLAFLPLLVPDDSNPDLISPQDVVGGDTDVVFAQDYGNYSQRHRHHHRHGDYQQGQSSYIPSPPLPPPSQSAFAPPIPPPPPPLQQASSSPGQPPGVYGVGWV